MDLAFHHHILTCRVWAGVQSLQPVDIAWYFLTRNVEPLAQTWIRCECLYPNGRNGLMSPKRIQSCRALRGVGYEPEARAGLNRST